MCGAIGILYHKWPPADIYILFEYKKITRYWVQLLGTGLSNAMI
jgi:hypothetical protein